MHSGNNNKTITTKQQNDGQSYRCEFKPCSGNNTKTITTKPQNDGQSDPCELTILRK